MRIAVFSKISKRKLGDRPQRIDFEPHAVLRGFLATKGRRDSRTSPRGGMHPMDANFANIDVGFASPLSQNLCSTTYDVVMY